MTEDKRVQPQDPGHEERTIELPEGFRKGGDVLNPSIAEPSEPGRLDAPATADPAPADSTAPDTTAPSGGTDQKE
jgi:hypothetical protein